MNGGYQTPARELSHDQADEKGGIDILNVNDSVPTEPGQEKKYRMKSESRGSDLSGELEPGPDDRHPFDRFRSRRTSMRAGHDRDLGPLQ
jgi:hypothetical protein